MTRHLVAGARGLASPALGYVRPANSWEELMKMVGSMRLWVPALALCALFAASAARAADVDNPEYKSWASVKPGTVVTKHNVTNAAGTKSEIDMTSTLVSVTP